LRNARYDTARRNIPANPAIIPYTVAVLTGIAWNRSPAANRTADSTSSPNPSKYRVFMSGPTGERRGGPTG